MFRAAAASYIAAYVVGEQDLHCDKAYGLALQDFDIQRIFVDVFLNLFLAVQPVALEHIIIWVLISAKTRNKEL